MKEAKYWYKKDDGKIQCILCPHGCQLKEGQVGFCKNRQNIGDVLYSINYGRISAIHNDPIEKKPLYHFYPGSSILSIGGIGCSLACDFCQNWELIEGKVRMLEVSPDKLAKIVDEYRSIGVSYTYNEPLIQFEYVLDCSKLLRQYNKVNVLVTNGYMEPEPFDELIPFIDALNIDLKFPDDYGYKKFCKGLVGPVIRNIEAAHKAGAHVEVTHLIVTGANDSEDSIQRVVEIIASIDTQIPLHFSRYFPHYKYNEPPTKQDILFRAWELAKKKLSYVYLGNLYSDTHSNTSCPSCGALLISRVGYSTKVIGLNGNKCYKCGHKIIGRF